MTKPVEPARLIETVAACCRPTAAAPVGAVAAGGDAPAAAAGMAGQEVAQIASHPRFRRAAPASEAPPPLDPQVLARLQALGDATFLAEVAADFLADAGQALATMEAALRERDVARFRAAAHALRSSAANIGATELSALCGALELLGRAELAAAGGQQLALLTAELGRVREALWSGQPGGDGSGAAPAGPLGRVH